MNQFVKIVILLVVLYFLFGDTKEKFTPSNKPMDHENSLFLHGPFDNVDYQTPAFYAM
jgi:hypothetical protein